MNSKPRHWIQTVERALGPLSEVPLWGLPPVIMWEKVSQQIAKALHLSDISFQVKETKWSERDQLLSGFGAEPQIFALEMTPLPHKFYWAMPREDMKRLCDWAMHSPSGSGFSDQELQRGFYQYLLLEVMNVLDDLKVWEDLSPKFSAAPFPENDSFTIDVAIKHGDATLWGRLICPENFKKAFAHHFGSKTRWTSIAKSSHGLPLTLHLEAGRTALSYEDFQKLSVGDCLLLDIASYSPDTKKGTMQLVLDGHPLFHVKVKEESIKILDYAHYYEELSMKDEREPDDFFEDDFDEELEEDFEDEEDEEAEEDEGSLENDSFPDADEESLSQSTENAPAELFSPEKVPLTLSVEVSRIKINLESLLQLTPGNTLELPTHPEQGVNLTLSGVTVARGELIQLGDLLGVKITEVSQKN